MTILYTLLWRQALLGKPILRDSAMRGGPDGLALRRGRAVSCGSTRTRDARSGSARASLSFGTAWGRLSIRNGDDTDREAR